MATDILWRIRECTYQLWEQEGRPEGRHLDHWVQAEHELVAENAMDFEFKQLMRAYRNGIISETTVEQLMAELEKRALSNGRSFSRRQGDVPCKDSCDGFGRIVCSSAFSWTNRL